MENYGVYTRKLEDLIWPLEPVEDDADTVLAWFRNQEPNAEHYFRPFADRLIYYLHEHTQDALPDADSAAGYLRDAAVAKGIPLNRNTIKNWCTGNSEPKHGDNDRDKMFQLAFTLGLNAEESGDFFRRVVLDRPFNMRRPEEFVYFYCLLHGENWAAAEAMIQQLSACQTVSVKDTVTVTEHLGDVVLYTGTPDDIVSYIQSHPNNFAKNRTYAKEQLKSFLSEIRGSADGQKGLAELVCEKNFVGAVSGERAVQKGRNPHSVDFFLQQLTGIEVKGRESVRDLLANRLILKEIVNQFPDANTFSLKEPSAYILRKELILTSFFCYFGSCLVYGSRVADDYDEFKEETNNILSACGFCELYPGNPYDWLFLCCAAQEQNQQLSALREVLSGSEES